jgi:hypothetical protein
VCNVINEKLHAKTHAEFANFSKMKIRKIGAIRNNDGQIFECGLAYEIEPKKLQSM